MTVRITQIDQKKNEQAILRVEGKLYQADAEILEVKFNELQEKKLRRIEIDLSEIIFLDSDSAAVLTALQKRGAILSGVNFFLRRVIEAAELRE